MRRISRKSISGKNIRGRKSRNNRKISALIKILCMTGIIFVAIGAVLWSYYADDNYNSVLKYKVTLYSKAQGNESIDLEEFVEGVVVSIVPADYEAETIKAMSIVVRTYIMQQVNEQGNGKLNVDGLDVCSVSMESLKKTLGEKVYQDTIRKYDDAVESTKGKIMTYKGNIIVPMYHIVSAGNTRNANEVLGVDAPYLICKRCPSDVACPDYLKIIEIDAAEMKEQVGDDAKITKTDAAGYVTQITTREGTVSGEEFASKFDLNSSCFTLEYIDDKVKVVTKGKGHGLGLSIYGANELAKSGKKCDEILKYFYEGIKIE